MLEEGERTIAESGAIIEYIFATRGSGKLSIRADDPAFSDYIYWFHYANSSLFLQIMLNLAVSAATDERHPTRTFRRERLNRHIDFVEARMREVPFFAGRIFTAADIMMHFSFGTMRRFFDLDLSVRPNIKSWLRRISERPAYQRAMKKAGHDTDPALPC